jgi:alkyl hydroperoxide reductase subunit AhpF
MAKPVLLVVDDDDVSLASLTRELQSRYGVHYRIASSPSAKEAVAQLQKLRGKGTSVALILADQWMPGGHGAEVTIVVRAESLATSMSEYLVREIAGASNVAVRYGTEIVSGGGDGRLQHLELRDRSSGTVESVPAGGVFVLIGAEPFTEWLPEAVSRDRWGFILTGQDISEGWTERRPPFLLETSLPGVFAVGDVRHDSVKRVASAVGDGSIVIRLAHQYLALHAEEAQRS